jgi:hypothetical protein
MLYPIFMIDSMLFFIIDAELCQLRSASVCGGQPPTARSCIVRRARPRSEHDAAFLAPRQVAVVAAVQEINGETDHKPNDKPQPSIARQADH